MGSEFLLLSKGVFKWSPGGVEMLYFVVPARLPSTCLWHQPFPPTALTHRPACLEHGFSGVSRHFWISTSSYNCGDVKSSLNKPHSLCLTTAMGTGGIVTDKWCGHMTLSFMTTSFSDWNSSPNYHCNLRTICTLLKAALQTPVQKPFSSLVNVGTNNWRHHLQNTHSVVDRQHFKYHQYNDCKAMGGGPRNALCSFKSITKLRVGPWTAKSLKGSVLLCEL